MKIQKSLDELLEEKTSIIIAHRLSTIKKVDRIFVLDKGKIVES
jgi:ABC-type multidrug transport system fused ATPase/permease subunit